MGQWFSASKSNAFDCEHDMPFSPTEKNHRSYVLMFLIPLGSNYSEILFSEKEKLNQEDIEIRLQTVSWTYLTSSVIEITKKGHWRALLLTVGYNPDYCEKIKQSSYCHLGWRNMPIAQRGWIVLLILLLMKISYLIEAKILLGLTWHMEAMKCSEGVNSNPGPLDQLQKGH